MPKQTQTPEAALIEKISALPDIPWVYDRPVDIVSVRAEDLGEHYALMVRAYELGLCRFRSNTFIMEKGALRDALAVTEEKKVGDLVDKIVQADLPWRYDVKEGGVCISVDTAMKLEQKENLLRAESCGLCYEKGGKIYLEENLPGKKSLYSEIVEPVITALKQCWNWARFSDAQNEMGIIRFHDEILAHRPAIEDGQKLGIIVAEVEGRCYIASHPELHLKFADVVPRQPFALTQEHAPDVNLAGRLNSIMFAQPAR